MQARIVDDDGRDLPDGTPGELLVRRAGADPQFGFFRAYFKDPDATAAAWADGWFHTGDIVMRNHDGHFFFRDRKKNIIRRSGENIAALEVETVLMRHAGAAALAVGPVPDPLREQEVACLVVPAPGVRAEDLFDQLFALAQDELAYFKAPGWFAAVDSLPLTGTQKLQRGALQAQLVQMLESDQLQDFRHRKSRRNRAAG
jgi:acyl-coenzyme A synthetase/AMP-(fatty) acid ligase